MALVLSEAGAHSRLLELQALFAKKTDRKGEILSFQANYFRGRLFHFDEEPHLKRRV